MKQLHRRTYEIYKIIGIAVLTGVLMMGGLNGTGLVRAEALDRPSVTTVSPVLTDFVTYEEITREETYLNIQMKIPVLKGLMDTKFQDELNDIIKRHAEKDIASFEAEAKKDANEAKKQNAEWQPYELSMDYELKADGTGNPNDIVSLEVVTSKSRGNNPEERKDFYNIRNVKEASRVTLKELFGPSYKPFIDRMIQNTMDRNPENYFPEEFQGISSEQGFYIQDNKAVIVFGKYEIAPGSMGSPEFEFPLFMLQGVDGDQVTLDQAQTYLTKDGNVMIPLRIVTERLGYELIWVKDTKSAELKKQAQWTSVTNGENAYFINKMAPQSLVEAPVIKNNKMYVPYAFVSEILGATLNLK